jgi:diguanylate cyclase (GGDEF)-like protein
MRSSTIDSDLELRLRTLQTGVWPTLAACGFAVAYAVATWSEPHRIVLLGMAGVALLSAIAVHALPVEPIIRRWPETFFLSWSASLVTVIAIGCLADGGTNSPVSAQFFLPLAFCSLSYPTRSLLAVGAMNLVVYAAVAVLGPHDFAHAGMFASALVTVTWICAWQTRNHDRRRAELAWASETDDLTGAQNRRGFEARAAAELARAARAGAEVGVILLDLDHFKSVNDTQGHEAGDELLRWVGATLALALREHDAVGRVGGDEFAVLLPGGDTEATLQRLRARLAPRARASAGAATYPYDGVDYTALCRTADARLYEGKATRLAA